MADETHRELVFPKIPDDTDDKMKSYLLELEKVLTDEFTGDRFIAGTLTVGGDLVQ